MIARTLCFASPGKLSARLCQLVWDGDDGVHKTIPIEDVALVVLESDKITITSSALCSLAESNVAVVVSGKTHIPVGQMTPYSANSTAAEATAFQLKATDAVNGRIWRQICRAKILNQGALLTRLGKVGEGRLRTLADAVKNGDPANCEAQAARIYFQMAAPSGFTRLRDGDWPNQALNYGYAVLRAAVARALVSSGLLCIKGIHHHNRYNTFALADDVMEPYRPFVDQYIFGKVKPFDVPAKELTKEMRGRLLQSLTCDVNLGDKRRPLMVALSYTSASLVRYYKKESQELMLPSFE